LGRGWQRHKYLWRGCCLRCRGGGLLSRGKAIVWA
jgi:hypothetical protein